MKEGILLGQEVIQELKATALPPGVGGPAVRGLDGVGDFPKGSEQEKAEVSELLKQKAALVKILPEMTGLVAGR